MKMSEVNLNPEELKAYKNAIDEIVNSMLRSSAESELVKDICDVQKEKYGIPPATTKKVATVIFKDNLEDERDKFETIESLVERVSN
jgi:uncharacterized protein YaaR (DUF327 family)